MVYQNERHYGFYQQYTSPDIPKTSNLFLIFAKLADRVMYHSATKFFDVTYCLITRFLVSLLYRASCSSFIYPVLRRPLK